MKKRCWTKEEIDYLESAWGNVSFSAIAKKLDRTTASVINKRNRLGLGSYAAGGDMISLNELAKAMGVEYHTCSETWVGRGLPICEKKILKRKIKKVDIEKFWAWAEKNKDIIDFSRMEKFILGKEPEWVEQARKFNFVGKKKTTKWTDAEITKLKVMLESGRFGYSEIAEELCRTEAAVKKRIYKLGLKMRAIRRTAKKWTKEEERLLVELYKSGCQWDEIGKRLGRSGSACGSKLDMLRNPEVGLRKVRKSKEALKGCFQKNFCVHYDRALGCEIGGTDCDECLDFLRRKEGEEQKSGWMTRKGT